MMRGLRPHNTASLALGVHAATVLSPALLATAALSAAELAEAGTQPVSRTHANPPSSAEPPAGDRLATRAPQKPGASVPHEEHARTLLRRLDRAFSSGSLQRVLALHDPGHASLHALWAKRFGPVLDPDLRLRRRSRLVRFSTVGEFGLALFRATVSDPDGTRSSRYTALLAFRVGADGAQSLFETEVDEVALQVSPPHEFRCGACNYRLAADQEWVMVPNRPDRVGCLESVSFYWLLGDLSVDLSIHLRAAQRAPRAELAALLGQVEGAGGIEDVRSEDVQIEDWLPPSHRGEHPPRPLRGARCLVPDLAGPGFRAMLHVATYGRVRYLFAVRGSAETLAAESAAIDDFLRGFSLLDPELEPDALARRLLRAHFGGELVDETYRNERVGVQFRGVSGWTAVQHAGHYLFDVTYRCPEDSGRLRVVGIEPHAEGARWTDASVDAMLERALAREGLEIIEDDGWEATDTEGFPRLRTLRARRRDAARADATRVIRFYRNDQLAVVFHGRCSDEDVMRVIEDCFDTLQMLR